MSGSALVSGRDFIIVGQQAWDVEIGSNCKNLAIEFGRHNRVLYVNYPLDRNTVQQEAEMERTKKRIAILEGNAPRIEQVGENIWALYPRVVLDSINRIPFHWLYRAFNKRNNQKFAAEIASAADELGFKDYIIFNDSDMFRSFYLKELLQPALQIYYTRDNLLAVDYWKRHGSRIEPELMAKSDFVAANSTYLADLARQHNPRSYYVGQGCDVSMFDEALITQKPADLEGIPSPIVGYVGALFSLRLDTGLLEYIAGEKPEWNFAFVGPEDEAFRRSRLHQLPNVTFLGRKDVTELPAYIKYFDVCLNPQLINDVTIGNYPRKIDEYLAMGKPTVATKTRAMSIFDGYTYQAATREEYLPLITAALAENDPGLRERRKAFARTHTWENNASAIYTHILETEAMRRP